MFKATREGLIQYLSNEVQAVAFSNNGWDVAAFEEEPESDETAVLRAQADALGINYHPNSGAVKLREKIEEFKLKKAAEKNQ